MPHSKETKPGSSGQEPSPSTSKNTRVVLLGQLSGHIIKSTKTR